MILTFINFSWRLWAQIKHVVLIEFTQVVWLLTNWWLGMNETNLTQHGRSTDVNASHVLYLRDKKKTLKKRGNLLRTTSFNGNSCRVRILIKIIMVCVRAALIIKALEYEFKWKYDFFETFLKHFFKHDFRFKNMTRQHGRSTDVNASHVLYLGDKKKTLKKRGNFLRTTSF